MEMQLLYWGRFALKQVRKKSACSTKCLANAGSASWSSVLMFSLSLSGVRPGVKPGVAAPRGVIPPPAWGVMPSWLWPGAGVLVARTVTVSVHRAWEEGGGSGGGDATWLVCWAQCWASGSAVSVESHRWSRSPAAACWGLLSGACQCWLAPSGSELPANTEVINNQREFKSTLKVDSRRKPSDLIFTPAVTRSRWVWRYSRFRPTGKFFLADLFFRHDIAHLVSKWCHSLYIYIFFTQ